MTLSTSKQQCLCLKELWKFAYTSAWMRSWTQSRWRCCKDSRINSKPLSHCWLKALRLSCHLSRWISWSSRRKVLYSNWFTSCLSATLTWYWVWPSETLATLTTCLSSLRKAFSQPSRLHSCQALRALRSCTTEAGRMEIRNSEQLWSR